jgi:hypothetical protein
MDQDPEGQKHVDQVDPEHCSALLTFGKLIHVTGGVALQRLVKHGAHQLRLSHLQVQLRSL